METKELKAKTSQELKAIKEQTLKKIDVLNKAGFEADQSLSSLAKTIDEILAKRVDEVFNEDVKGHMANVTLSKKFDKEKFAELIGEGKNVTLTFNKETGEIGISLNVKKSGGGASAGTGTGEAKTPNPFGAYIVNGKEVTTAAAACNEAKTFLVANGTPDFKFPEKTSMFRELKKLLKGNANLKEVVTAKLKSDGTVVNADAILAHE